MSAQFDHDEDGAVIQMALRWASSTVAVLLIVAIIAVGWKLMGL